MSVNPIDVMLVDDHQMILQGLAELVGKDPQLRVVAQCQDALKVLAQANELHPHVIVLDIVMKGLNGLDLCRDLKRKLKDVAVLMLTMHDDREFQARAIENGASGYVVKGAPAHDLMEAIHAVAEGRMWLPGGVSKELLDRVRSAQKDPFDRLTSRERQVFQMIVEGKTSRQIGEQLGLALKTVEAHRMKMMKKLDSHNVQDLVMIAVRRGMIRPSEQK